MAMGDRQESITTRLRVFREEEFEEPTQPGILFRALGSQQVPRFPEPLPPPPPGPPASTARPVDPFDETEVPAAVRTRAPRPTQPLPLPRPPRR